MTYRDTQRPLSRHAAACWRRADARARVALRTVTSF